MFTNAAQKIAGKHFYCAPPQGFLLPLDTEHLELLLLLLTQGVTIANLGTKVISYAKNTIQPQWHIMKRDEMRPTEQDMSFAHLAQADLSY